jgi:hypothetical protein
MDVTPEETGKRPYAAPSNVLAVLDRCRSVNLPTAIDDDFLRVVGITPVVFNRVKAALRFLGLIGKDGRPTDKLKALAAAPPGGEYEQLLAGVVREAYREDFERVNPATDSNAQIMAHFHRYEPRSQTQRMVMLFLGLSRAAGIEVQDAPRERRMKQAPAKPPAKKLAASGKARPSVDEPTPSVPSSSSIGPPLLFGVSEDDVAALDDVEFDEVWAALGKVARARARARATTRVTPAEDTADTDGGEGEALV